MKFIAAGLAVTTRAALFGSAAALCLGLPAAAFAQNADEAQPAPEAAADDGEGNEIVVTATKREQTLQDVPVAVSVTTAETIERAQIRDIKDLSSVVPSLRVNQLQSSANTNFFIRGFGNGANNAGIEPSVGLFVDGVYRSRSASMIADLPDVQRVEVLRGPQSTLFGKNASAGVISLVTREPKFNFGGNVEASYGEFNALVVKGVVTGPISESIAVSLAGGINKRDGYVTNLVNGNKTNERDRWFVRGQMLFEPSDDLKVRLIGDYGKIDEVCCAVVNLRASQATGAVLLLGGRVNDAANPFGDVLYNNFDSTNRIKNWGLSGQIDYNMGILKLTSITAFRRTSAITNQDTDFTSADLLGNNYQDVRLNTFTQELRASTDWDGPVNALIGGFYFNEKVYQDNSISWGRDARNYANILMQGLTGCPTSPGCTTVNTLEARLSALSGRSLGGTFFLQGQGMNEQYTLKNEALSFFSQVDFEVSDRLTLTGGVNYTNDKKNWSTNTVSNDVFAGLDLTALGRSAILAQALIGAGVNPSNPAEVGAFATAPATAPIFQAMNAFATANATNPAVNSLLNLVPLQFFPPFMNLPNAVEPARTSGSNWSFTARAAYEVTDTISVYAGVATGYKGASVNLSRDSRPTPADLVQINTRGIGVSNLTSGTRFAGPEKATVYELGIKANWGIASANVAVFQQSIRGFQSNIFTGTGFLLDNAGKQSSFGVEFEGMVKPSTELTITAAVTYLDPKYDSFNARGLGDLSGTRPGGVTQLSTTLGAQWDKELGNGDHIILRGDWHYEAPFQLVEGLPGFVSFAGVAGAIKAAADFKQEISQINASLSYAMANGLELTVWGRNLTNRRNIMQIFDSVAQRGSISGYPSEPRTWGGSVRFRW